METQFEYIARLGLAALLGAIIGLEREMQGKEAGLRTIMLVAFGSALFTIISYRMSYMLTGSVEDYTRIASYTVSSIGFLCAGLIFRSEIGVQGLTTAATVWTVTAIGMATGIGMYRVAFAATFLCIIILLVINSLEDSLETINLKRVYFLKTSESISEEYLVQQYFSGKKLKLLTIESMRADKLNEFTVSLRGPKREHKTAVKALLKDERILELKY